MSTALKEEVSRLRRDHILQAATEVFAKHGFRGATIRQVANTAGVADGTIYNVFANKDALLNALLDKLQPDQNEEPRDTMSGLFLQRADALSPDTLKILRVVLAEALVDPNLRGKFLKRVLMPAIEPLESHLKDKDLSRVLVAGFVGVAVLKLLGEPHATSNTTDILQKMADLFGGRLGP
jgi:AcrR family transcriptional regulator